MTCYLPFSLSFISGEFIALSIKSGDVTRIGRYPQKFSIWKNAHANAHPAWDKDESLKLPSSGLELHGWIGPRMTSVAMAMSEIVAVVWCELWLSHVITGGGGTLPYA